MFKRQSTRDMTDSFIWNTRKSGHFGPCVPIKEVPLQPCETRSRTKARKGSEVNIWR